ncbi:hypothetical protein C8R47DRAFT_1192229 [Mycena vitilis]|nr:hypothetical protein C8R47DRAFT_1192229 [Mycena vitilis]
MRVHNPAGEWAYQGLRASECRADADPREGFLSPSTSRLVDDGSNGRTYIDHSRTPDAHAFKFAMGSMAAPLHAGAHNASGGHILSAPPPTGSPTARALDGRQTTQTRHREQHQPPRWPRMRTAGRHVDGLTHLRPRSTPAPCDGDDDGVLAAKGAHPLPHAVSLLRDGAPHPRVHTVLGARSPRPRTTAARCRRLPHCGSQSPMPPAANARDLLPLKTGMSAPHADDAVRVVRNHTSAPAPRPGPTGKTASRRNVPSTLQSPVPIAAGCKRARPPLRLGCLHRMRARRPQSYAHLPHLAAPPRPARQPREEKKRRKKRYIGTYVARALSLLRKLGIRVEWKGRRRGEGRECGDIGHLGIPLVHVPSRTRAPLPHTPSAAQGPRTSNLLLARRPRITLAHTRRPRLRPCRQTHPRATPTDAHRNPPPLASPHRTTAHPSARSPGRALVHKRQTRALIPSHAIDLYPSLEWIPNARAQALTTGRFCGCQKDEINHEDQDCENAPDRKSARSRGHLGSEDHTHQASALTHRERVLVCRQTWCGDGAHLLAPHRPQAAIIRLSTRAVRITPRERRISPGRLELDKKHISQLVRMRRRKEARER